MFEWLDPLRELALANAAYRYTGPEPLSSSGTLLVTAEGIFLWPGSPLLTKRGGRFVLRPRDRIYDLVCRLHGPRAAWTPLVPTLEQAAARLNDADIGAARLCLDRLNLPPLSRAGVDLMRAIAKRLGLEPLSLPLAPNDNVGLRLDLAAGLAEAYDEAVSGLWPLRKVAAGSDFDRTHPRLEGPPNAGWFVTLAADNAAAHNYKRFFDQLYGPLRGLAANLGLPENYILGLAAYESGYFGDHDLGLNNPFGFTHAGGNNIAYASIDQAVSAWRARYGDQVTGANSPADFAQRLEGLRDGVPVPGWNRYNSRNAQWETQLVGVINSIDRHKEKWLQNQ